MDYTRNIRTSQAMPKLTDTMVLEEARDALAEALPLEADGYVCTTRDLWQILLGVSVEGKTMAPRRATFHGMCESLIDAPSDVSIRGYLNAQLTVERLPEIEDCLNRALAMQIPTRVFKHPLGGVFRARDTSIDMHAEGPCGDQAYYGKTEQDEAVRPVRGAGLWIRAQAQDGTTRFYGPSNGPLPYCHSVRELARPALDIGNKVRYSRR